MVPDLPAVRPASSTARELLADAYLDRPEQWAALVRLVRLVGCCGLDTEFYNVDPSAQSCVGRAKIHVWSIAVRTKRLSPLGFHYCRGWMLPAAALEFPALKELLEDAAIRKELHNQPVDSHAFRNHGVILRGGRNTLGLVRWTHPGLINQPGRFKLKALMVSLLRREPICSFKQVVGFTWIEWVPRLKKVKVSLCSCGEAGCRKRKGHEKTKRVDEVTVYRERKVDDEYPLESILPADGYRLEHPRWALLILYAIEDAIAALQIAELADEAEDPAPWPYGGVRPTFSQEDEEATIALEAVGFHVDVPWCTATHEVASADEERELVWLHRWYIVNAPTYGPWKRENGTTKGGTPVKNGLDSLWGSPTKKLALFDELGFPRSPIWAKGRVKPGEAKMDWKAMEWIAKNHPPAKQVIPHLLELQKIRSNKKYLSKLRDSGGYVHPICGPAGDEDDRAGAVTGRKAIKGEFEAQQLPTKEEKDKYNVRKAVIAG